VSEEFFAVAMDTEFFMNESEKPVIWNRKVFFLKCIASYTAKPYLILIIAYNFPVWLKGLARHTSMDLGCIGVCYNAWLKGLWKTSKVAYLWWGPRPEKTFRITHHSPACTEHRIHWLVHRWVRAPNWRWVCGYRSFPRRFEERQDLKLVSVWFENYVPLTL